MTITILSSSHLLDDEHDAIEISFHDAYIMVRSIIVGRSDDVGRTVPCSVDLPLLSRGKSLKLFWSRHALSGHVGRRCGGGPSEGRKEGSDANGEDGRTHFGRRREYSLCVQDGILN